MSRKIDFGSYSKVSSRQNIALIYLFAVILAFLYIFFEVKNERDTDTTLWQLVAGFFFGNVLGFYVTIIKYRINIFSRPYNFIEYINIFVLVVFSIASVWVGLDLLSGNGHQAAVIGAVAAVVVFIPAIFESWLVAKQEHDCLVAIRSEIERVNFSSEKDSGHSSLRADK